MNKKTFFFIVSLVILGYFIYTHLPRNSSQPATKNTPVITQEVKVVQIGVRTKIIGCQANGPIQDLACTPGAVNPDLTKDVICSPSFTTKTVRSVPTEEKKQVYDEYGIASHTKGEYEVDHLISLELGGANDIANLWPEQADPRPGFHEKDTVENYLHRQVCSGAISLQDAQKEVANNWIQVYQSM